MTADKLIRKCPFCGGDPRFELTATENVIRCAACHVAMIWRRDGTDSIFDGWNTRQIETAYLDLLEEFWKTWMVERKYIEEEAVLKLEKLLKDAGSLK